MHYVPIPAICPMGSYENQSICVRCEPGTYGTEEGQTRCLQCPDGYTTLYYGSTNISDCSGRSFVRFENNLAQQWIFTPNESDY